MKSPDDIPGQERISDDRLGEGKLDGQRCEWCENNATVALPIMRKIKGGKAGAVAETGMHSYACDVHREIAERCNTVRPAL